MFMTYKLTPADVPVDILRAPVNRSRNYSLIMLVTGHGQVGKTTAIWYMANRMMQIRKGLLNPYDPRITWREWDAKNLTAMNAKDFVRLWNNSSDSILTLSESSTTLYYMDWMQVMARVFNSTTTTQGLKHNICFLDTVMATEIMQKARDKLDYRVEVHKRNDYLRLAQIRSGYILIDYLRDRWKLIPYNQWDLIYPLKALLMSKEYTDWVAGTMKKEEAEENERRVGLIEDYDRNKPISDKNCPDWMKEII